MLDLNAKNFILHRNEFQLGELLTESSHPKTQELSELVKTDLKKSISLLQSIDKDVFDNVEKYSARIYELSTSIQQLRENGGRLFLCGCGATGRLSLAIEAFYRQLNANEFIISFMAGGDYALIKSVESFEDSKEFGKRQLMDLGFSENDMLLGITEGGETSFVIGATEAASEISQLNPYFIYCNPDECLENIERSKAVLENNKIKKLNLTTGPMALAGSTRMQATTIQMLAVSFALFDFDTDYSVFEQKLTSLMQAYKNIDLSNLSKLIEFEYKHYKNQGIVTYLTNAHSAMTVLTDTTERSPTFSLAPFEKQSESHFSLAYLVIENMQSPKLAWKELLAREPRCLTWEDIQLDLSLEQLYQFTISEEALERRNKENNKIIRINMQEQGYLFEFDKGAIEIDLNITHPVYKEIALKTILNIHSTLIMGLLGRYEQNMMTYVKPSNLKLIDRSLRYIKKILNDDSINESDLITKLFSEIKNLKSNEAIVLKVVELLKKN